MSFQSSRQVEILQQDKDGRIASLPSAFPESLSCLVPWALMPPSGSSSAITAPVTSSLLFPKRCQIHRVMWPSCRPAECSCIPSFIRLTFIMCLLSVAAPWKIDAHFINEQTEVWRVVRWFVSNLTASGGCAGARPETFQRPLPNTPSLALLYSGSHWNHRPFTYQLRTFCSSKTETPGWLWHY